MAKIQEWLSKTLKSLGLRPIYKSGKAKFGESTLQKIEQRRVYDGFFTDITFQDTAPWFGVRDFTVRFNHQFNQSDGAVIFVEIEGAGCLIIKQWRKSGRWTHEIPRGFAIDNHQGSLALSILENDIGELAMKLLTINQVVDLGEVDENTGTSCISPQFFLVRASANHQNLIDCYDKNHPVKLDVWSHQKLWQEIGGKIRDNHSIAAVSLAFKYLGVLRA
ncbi:hypothetical protein KKG46_02240 [Patescibacteria group bacterium]|nr:hypothetical protein [Patescibacteria group bacterium]